MIRDRSEELHTFHARHFAEQVGERPASTNEHRGGLTDEEIIELARGAKNAAKFEALWSGDTSDYPSHSEADQALLSLLAFYSQDEEQLDRLYRWSGLCRQKWLNRPDYRRITINRALSGLIETYAPDDGARMLIGNGSAQPVSRRPNLYRDETRDTRPEVIRLVDVERPGPRRYLCQDLVLAAYVTLLHGDGGVARGRALQLSLRCRRVYGPSTEEDGSPETGFPEEGFWPGSAQPEADHCSMGWEHKGFGLTP